MTADELTTLAVGVDDADMATRCLVMSLVLVAHIDGASDAYKRGAIERLFRRERVKESDHVYQ